MTNEQTNEVIELNQEPDDVKVTVVKKVKLAKYSGRPEGHQFVLYISKEDAESCGLKVDGWSLTEQGVPVANVLSMTSMKGGLLWYSVYRMARNTNTTKRLDGSHEKPFDAIQEVHKRVQQKIKEWRKAVLKTKVVTVVTLRVELEFRDDKLMGKVVKSDSQYTEQPTRLAFYKRGDAAALGNDGTWRSTEKQYWSSQSLDRSDFVNDGVTSWNVKANSYTIGYHAEVSLRTDVATIDTDKLVQDMLKKLVARATRDADMHVQLVAAAQSLCSTYTLAQPR